MIASTSSLSVAILIISLEKYGSVLLTMFFSVSHFRVTQYFPTLLVLSLIAPRPIFITCVWGRNSVCSRVLRPGKEYEIKRKRFLRQVFVKYCRKPQNHQNEASVTSEMPNRQTGISALHLKICAVVDSLALQCSKDLRL
jgi:hypothetical protein